MHSSSDLERTAESLLEKLTVKGSVVSDQRRACVFTHPHLTLFLHNWMTKSLFGKSVRFELYSSDKSSLGLSRWTGELMTGYEPRTPRSLSGNNFWLVNRGRVEPLLPYLPLPLCMCPVRSRVDELPVFSGLGDRWCKWRPPRVDHWLRRSGWKLEGLWFPPCLEMKVRRSLGHPLQLQVALKRGWGSRLPTARRFGSQSESRPRERSPDRGRGPLEGQEKISPGRCLSMDWGPLTQTDDQAGVRVNFDVNFDNQMSSGIL